MRLQLLWMINGYIFYVLGVMFIGLTAEYKKDLKPQFNI